MKEKSLVEYEGFEFSSPLFAYLGDYGTKEVVSEGSRSLSKVELGLDPRECATDSDDDDTY